MPENITVNSAVTHPPSSNNILRVYIFKGTLNLSFELIAHHDGIALLLASSCNRTAHLKNEVLTKFHERANKHLVLRIDVRVDGTAAVGWSGDGTWYESN